MTQISSDLINILLEFIWVPVVLPLIIVLFKSTLHVKEIKKSTNSNIEDFVNLYNTRIKENLRICAEEILQFVDKREGEKIEHHLYICKKLNKTVGFVKLMFSEPLHYVFIAYVAIDKNDSIARKYGLNIMVNKIYKKYFKSKKANILLIEIERASNGRYITSLAKLISRYSKKIKKQSYIIDFDYIQPSMPNDNFDDVGDDILSLVYVPIYSLANERIPKNELISLLQSIYFDIYYPSCKEITTCDCNDYNIYLENIMDLYVDSLPDYIKLIPIDI